MTFSRLWLTLFALGFAPLLLSGVLPAGVGVALAVLWYALLVGLAIADWRLFPPLEKLIVERDVDEKLSLGVENAVRIRIHNATNAPAHLELRDSPPEAIPNDLDDLPLVFALPPNSHHVVTYHLRPTLRGDYAFDDLFIRVRGRLGMAHRLRRIPAARIIKVYPNLQNRRSLRLWRGGGSCSRWAFARRDCRARGANSRACATISPTTNCGAWTGKRRRGAGS